MDHPTFTSARTAMTGVALAALVVAACGASGGGSPARSVSPAAEAPSPTTTPPSTAVPSASPVPVASPDRNPTAVLDGVDYGPVIDPAEFSATIDNPYLPLVPGTVHVYEGDGERIEYTVTGATREVMGVSTVVVHDRAFDAGKLVEDTQDWFAQDRAGNVWYFGEDTATCKDGKVVDHHGAWEAGVDGAQPGVVMLARPVVGDSYRQEFYAGEAEDQARVLEIGSTLTTMDRTYDDILMTADFTPLEPDLLEHKLYARGVGVVEERTIQGGSGVIRLVSVSRDPSALEPAATFDPCRE